MRKRIISHDGIIYDDYYRSLEPSKLKGTIQQIEAIIELLYPSLTMDRMINDEIEILLRGNYPIACQVVLEKAFPGSNEIPKDSLYARFLDVYERKAREGSILAIKVLNDEILNNLTSDHGYFLITRYGRWIRDFDALLSFHKKYHKEFVLALNHVVDLALSGNSDANRFFDAHLPRLLEEDKNLLVICSPLIKDASLIEKSHLPGEEYSEVELRILNDLARSGDRHSRQIISNKIKTMLSARNSRARVAILRTSYEHIHDIEMVRVSLGDKDTIRAALLYLAQRTRNGDVNARHMLMAEIDERIKPDSIDHDVVTSIIFTSADFLQERHWMTLSYPKMDSFTRKMVAEYGILSTPVISELNKPSEINDHDYDGQIAKIISDRKQMGYLDRIPTILINGEHEFVLYGSLQICELEWKIIDLDTFLDFRGNEALINELWLGMIMSEVRTHFVHFYKIGTLINLERLNLSNCTIDELPPASFLKKLREIHVDSDDIYDIFHQIDDLSSLIKYNFDI
ncbi:MAG: leucine-rich repeat domain-containing protein [Candidatus Sigynarchaeota archaeon]